jgi:TRAP transporter 4TM/12TM fusion protein
MSEEISADSQIKKVGEAESPKKAGLSRYWFLPWPLKILFIGCAVVALVVFMLFWFSVPIGGRVLTGTFYYYLLYATLGFNVFIGLGATKAQKMKSPPWFDYVLAFALWGAMIFFLANHEAIAVRSWEPPPSALHFGLAVMVGLMTLEAARRIGSWGFVGMLIFAIAYPLVAGYMPGIFYGVQLTPAELIGDFAFGANGMLGIPGRLLGHLVIGFYFFAGIMMGSGGGEFFLKLAVSLAGKYRGGPSKVAVIASGFFGSLSGSVIANIAGTGAFTIPAMKRMGYEPEYAAAIEACASTGGDTMPPIMGGVFLMIVIAGVEYADVLVAVIIPSLLFYFGLLTQVDGYAATHNLKGLPKSEIPNVWVVLREGWIYIATIGFLVFGLVYMRWGIVVPIYAVGVMVVLSFTSKKTRLTWRVVESALSHYAGLLNFGVGVFMAMGFFMVGLLKTGVAASITSWVVSLGAGNVYLILLLGVVFSLVMGMVGLDRTSYLFLAVTLAPAVISMTGMHPIAIHLFLVYYGGMGGLTPPVAIHAYVAAGIAGANPVQTSYKTVRLGIVLALVPFFFVLQPALIMLDSTAFDIVTHLAAAMVGIWMLASGLEGYMLKIGKLNWWERLLFFIGGFLFAFPGWITTLIGAAICVAAAFLALAAKRRGNLKLST